MNAYNKISQFVRVFLACLTRTLASVCLALSTSSSHPWSFRHVPVINDWIGYSAPFTVNYSLINNSPTVCKVHVLYMQRVQVGVIFGWPRIKNDL
jgi:hypothetical protein